MSNAPISTQNGDVPTKVVFLGLAGNNAQALTLYNRIAGEVSAFLGKARQNRTISDSPSQYMRQARPDGGSFRYQYNNGIETVYVTLTTSETSFATTPQPVEPQLVDPRLAIDVLFDNNTFVGGDVFAFTTTTVYIPSVPGTPGEYTQALYRYDPGVGASVPGPFTLEQIIGSEDFSHIDEVIGTRVLMLDSSTLSSGLASALDNVLLSSSPTPDIKQTVIIARYVDDGFHDYGGWGGQPFYVTVSLEDYQPGIPGQPASTRTDKNYTRDMREYFDVLEMVGLVGDPEPQDPKAEPYEAKSTNEREDARLVSAEELRVVGSIQRVLVVGDVAPPGFVGAGFLAAPRLPQTKLTSPGKTIIDVYVASNNVSQKNSFATAREGAVFGIDNPSFRYEATDAFKGRVRVREFSDISPGAVRVVTKTQMRRTQYHGLPNSNPTIPDGSDGEGLLLDFGVAGDSDPARTATWFFAAAPNWEDNGNEPAKPDVKDSKGKATMGDLLDELEIDMNVVGPQPVERKFYTTLGWDGKVVTMTKIARIAWTPPSHPHVKGKATIDAAG